MTVAFVFPGQGAQSVGLLHQLPPHAEVARTIADAGEVLARDMASLDSVETQRSTAAVQLGLLVAGVATARALIAEKVVPDAVAGMSVGAFGAAVVCGTLSFAEALRLVRLRGDLMQAAFPSGYGLTAIVGLDEVQVDALVERTRTGGQPVYVSNINAPRQLVVAGSETALTEAAALAIQHGALAASTDWRSAFRRIARSFSRSQNACSKRWQESSCGSRQCPTSAIAAVVPFETPRRFARTSPPTSRIRCGGTTRSKS